MGLFLGEADGSSFPFDLVRPLIVRAVKLRRVGHAAATRFPAGHEATHDTARADIAESEDLLLERFELGVLRGRQVFMVDRIQASSNRTAR